MVPLLEYPRGFPGDKCLIQEGSAWQIKVCCEYVQQLAVAMFGICTSVSVFLWCVN